MGAKLNTRREEFESLFLVSVTKGMDLKIGGVANLRYCGPLSVTGSLSEITL